MWNVDLFFLFIFEICKFRLFAILYFWNLVCFCWKCWNYYVVKCWNLIVFLILNFRNFKTLKLLNFDILKVWSFGIFKLLFVFVLFNLNFWKCWLFGSCVKKIKKFEIVAFGDFALLKCWNFIMFLYNQKCHVVVYVLN